jgi:hypothetical protein
LGSYSLSDFSRISVEGQRVQCTFIALDSEDFKLVLHARNHEDAKWWARRMRLHQVGLKC